jgi:rhodanese-related sulfurtransferase
MKLQANKPTVPQSVVLNGPGVLQIRRPDDLLQWHSIGMIDVVTLTLHASSTELDRPAIVNCDMSIGDARMATLIAIYQGRIGNRKSDKGPLTIEQFAAFAQATRTSLRSAVPIEVRLEALTASQGWVTDGGLRGRLESNSPNVAPIFKRWTL